MIRFPRSRGPKHTLTALAVAGLSGSVFCGHVSAQESGTDGGGIQFWKKREEASVPMTPESMSLKRSLPSFDAESAEPAMRDPSMPAGATGKPLQHFVPTGPPPSSIQPKVRKTAATPATVPVAPVVDEKDTAFNPKFGIPQFDQSSMEENKAPEGALTTASGTALQQYVAPPNSLKAPKPVKAPKVQAAPAVEVPKVVDSGLTPEQEELYARLPMPSFQVEVPDVSATPSGPVDASGSALTQFTPTGPPPSAVKKVARQKSGASVATADAEALALSAEQASYFESDSRFSMPGLDMAAAEAAAAKPLPGQPVTSSGSVLQQYQPDPAAIAKAQRKQAAQASAAPSEPTVKTAAETKAELDALMKKQSDYYATETPFAMPSFEPEPQVLHDPADGPATASGSALKQFVPSSSGRKSN